MKTHPQPLSKKRGEKLRKEKMKIIYDDRNLEIFSKKEYAGLGFGKEVPENLENADYERLPTVPTMFLENGKLAYIHIPTFDLDRFLKEVNRSDDYFAETFDVPELKLKDVTLIEVIEYIGLKI